VQSRLAGIFWALLFLAVPVLGVATFAVAPAIDVWLPKDVSVHGASIDALFYFILGLTGIVFVATEVLLFWFLWKYDAAKATGPATYIQGSHTLEVVWTIIPAAILLFLAIYQMNAWADVKMRRPAMQPTVEVVARQFEWRLRYPGRDGELGTADDLHLVNDLTLPVDEEILVQLKSMDVQPADQAGRRARHEDPGLVQGDRDRRIRHRVCRALRLGALQDEGPHHVREPARIRLLARAAVCRAAGHAARARDAGTGQRRMIHESHPGDLP
jgi:hypothetical protein